MSIFSSAWDWIKKEAIAFEDTIAPFIVAIVEDIQKLINSGTLGFIANLLEALTKTQIPTEAVAAISKVLPSILASALALEQPPAISDTAAFAAWEQKVLAAWGALTDRSKVITTIGADLLGIVNRNIMSGQKLTFAELVGDLEEAFQYYQSATTDDSNS